MLNLSPIGRCCSQEERLQFVAYDKEYGVRQKFVKKLRDFTEGWDLNICIGKCSFHFFLLFNSLMVYILQVVKSVLTFFRTVGTKHTVYSSWMVSIQFTFLATGLHRFVIISCTVLLIQYLPEVLCIVNFVLVCIYFSFLGRQWLRFVYSS